MTIPSMLHIFLLWEPGGSLSVFLSSQYKTVTPADMQLVVKPFLFPMPIIKEGQIDMETLNQLGKDEVCWKIELKHRSQLILRKFY